MDHKQAISEACRAHGFSIVGEVWGEDTDYAVPRPKAMLGRVRVVEGNEGQALVEGAEGTLEAEVVGGAEYGNEEVAFFFIEDGFDGSIQVDPEQVMLLDEPEAA